MSDDVSLKVEVPVSYRGNNRIAGTLVSAVMVLGIAWQAVGQDVEPRRWSPVPVDINYAGAFYGYTRGDVLFDPVLQLEDVTMDLQTVAVKYLRTFALLDRSARAEILLPYQDAEWDGLLKGEPATAYRTGFSDPSVRFAVNLIGVPPLSGKEFAEHRASHPVETTVGMGLLVRLPLGQYYEDKLLNLGENRLAVRPELGVEHSYHKWLFELTGSALIFADNDEFWNGNKLEQDPLCVMQGHVNYFLRPGMWVGCGAAYGFAGESAINGVDKGDDKGNLISGLVFGMPLSRGMGLRLSYLNNHTTKDTGLNSDTLAVSVSSMF